MLDAHLDAGLTEEERQAANTVIDLDADETTCPACQGKIRPTDSACPECGLRFA